MSEWNTKDPEQGPWDNLVWFDEFRPNPGVPIGAAIERLAAWEGKEAAQKVAMDYLRTGLWSATCQRGFQRQAVVKMAIKGGFPSMLSKLDSRVGHFQSKFALAAGHVNSEFWNDTHGGAGQDWAVTTGFFFPDAARMHLDRGLVEAFKGYFREDIEEEDFFAVRVTLFGVEISEEDVDATAPMKAGAKQDSKRTTTYDWETAFADVAAAFYYDVQFENLEARGNQSRIIELLRGSFERRKLAVPSDDTLKPKARAILGALRSKKP